MSAGLPLAVVIAAQRSALLRQDAATLQLLLRSWLPVQARLNDSLERLLAAIGDDTPTPDQLRRMTRYRDLIEQTKTLTDGYAEGALPRITAAQRAATGLAQQHTAALLGPSGARLPVEAVSELVGALSDGSPLEKLLATFGDDAAKAASQTLVDGLATGRGLRVIASEFRKATGSSAVRAARISRTETLRAYRGATLETYKENRKIVKQWRWLSARQARTCATCWARDGMVFDVDEPFVSHIQCRCTPVPVLPDVPVGATGAELFNRLEDAQQRGILGRGRFDLFKAGELDITDIPVEVDAGRWGKALRQRTLRELRTSNVAKVTTRKAPPFMPATSIQQAEAFAQSLGVSVNYRGELAIGNMLNETLAEINALGVRLPKAMSIDAAYFEDFGPNALYIPGSYFPDLERVVFNPKSMPLAEQGGHLADVTRQQFDAGFWSTKHPRAIIRHEIGHAAHHQVIGDRYIESAIKAWPEDAVEQLQGKVSHYAMTQPRELVAEVFTGLVDGRTYDADVMKWYREFGGPEL